MITKVSIKKVASYGDYPAILETTKKFNFIYGINGTGKTTLSNFFANKDSDEFSDCSIEGLSDEKILVYNQNFIEENFHDVDTQKGIFTLSSENKAAEEKIKKATDEINVLNLELRDNEKDIGLEIELDNKKNAIERLKEVSREKTWEIKTTYSGGDRILEFCLYGKKGSQDILFDHIRNIQKPESKPEKTIEELKAEAEATQGQSAQTHSEDAIQKIEYPFADVEDKRIFSEIIIGNENLQIANLIKQLKNDDWVKQGLDYIKNPVEINDSEGLKELEMEQCPFCQEQTISKQFHRQIRDYFDESYQNKIAEIEKLDSAYWSAWQGVKTNEVELLKNDFIKKRETEFRLLYKNFNEKLSSNWSKINNKLKKPSEVVELESTDLEKTALNDFLEEIIKEIKLHNLKIKNKEATKKEIVNTFWAIMRWNYDQTIESFNSQLKQLVQERDQIDIKISDLKTQINKKREAIKLAQKETVNIDEAITNINNQLNFLATAGFKIEKHGDDSYRIERSNKGGAQFKTLSEGEKTIISFLYFVELCKGKESEDETVTEKIVVIDDPISSLSHIFIFNVAQLIKNTFLTAGYKQVFVLTHSLYFFHELCKYVKKKEDKNVFRIVKTNKGESKIKSLKENEIQNEYQSYWQIIKDHNNGYSSDPLLANTMRNILEHFFGFIDKDKLSEAIKNIESESEYQFFLRYIQRESHSDLTNIADMKETDLDIFKKAFKDIFASSGYEDHYNKMMS